MTEENNKDTLRSLEEAYMSGRIDMETYVRERKKILFGDKKKAK